jgi:hypothetical protein
LGHLAGVSESFDIGGHAFLQKLRRGHYELGAEARNCHLLVASAFDELAAAV